ncbi:MAG: hypothetical protein ACRDJ9_23780 [Dehalococcoidia bacterium]
MISLDEPPADASITFGASAIPAEPCPSPAGCIYTGRLFGPAQAEDASALVWMTQWTFSEGTTAELTPSSEFEPVSRLAPGSFTLEGYLNAAVEKDDGGQPGAGEILSRCAVWVTLTADDKGVHAEFDFRQPDRCTIALTKDTHHPSVTESPQP